MTTRNEFANYVKKTDEQFEELDEQFEQLNALKLQGTRTDTNNDNGMEPFCFDCNKKGVKRGHKGCPSPGSGNFHPNKNKDKQPYQHPTIEKKTENGVTKLYCKKCTKMLKDGRKVKGMWCSTTNPNAHMTCDHDKIFPTDDNTNANVLIAPPGTSFCMPVGADSIPPPNKNFRKFPPSPPPPLPSPADIQALLKLPDSAIHEKLKSYAASASKPASLKPSPMLVEQTPAPHPSGELELAFGLMDDVNNGVNDNEAFQDSAVDPAWFASLNFADEDEDTDPDANKVSFSSDPFYDTLEDTATPIEPENFRKFSLSVHSLPFSSWTTLRSYYMVQMLSTLPFLCYIDSSNISFSTLLLVMVDASLGIHQLLQMPRSLVEYLKSILTSYVSSGPSTVGNYFCYPASLMILSCVMISSSFVLMFSAKEYLSVTLGFLMASIGFIRYKNWLGFDSIASRLKISKSNSKPHNISSKSSHRRARQQCLTPPKSLLLTSNVPNWSMCKERLSRLALLAALGRLNSLPGIWTSSAYALKTTLQSHCSYLGMLDACTVCNTPAISPLQDYLANDFKLKSKMLPGCLHFIVNTGCSISCSPDHKDFESIQPLAKPITMKGVTGDVVCEYGGMINVQVIKANGDIVRLCTPGYYNPHQHVHLFSPQSLLFNAKMTRVSYFVLGQSLSHPSQDRNVASVY